VEQQAVQAPVCQRMAGRFRCPRQSGAGRTSIRWDGASAANWQIFLDTDQNSKTGYNGGAFSVGAEYMFATEAGTGRLWQYTGTGTDWSWKEIAAACRARPSPIPAFRLRASIRQAWAARRQ